MRGIIIYAVLLSAVSGYKTGYASHQQQLQQYQQNQQQLLKDTTEQAVVKESTSPVVTTTTIASTTSNAPSSSTIEANEPSSSTSTTAAISSTNALALGSSSGAPKPTTTESVEFISNLPITFPPELESGEYTKRRLINYDQRQEGQYNIRADLDNFMIVLIPPSPSGGLGLLDLLTKSALRRNSNFGKPQRKHYSGSSGLKTAGSTKFHQGVKAASINQNFNYLARQPLHTDIGRGRYQNMQLAHMRPISIDEDGSGTASQRLSEFIEGRTPYHVDISASDDEQSRLHPDRQVDVLPPPYPLAYQQLIKPFHLEVEALPPTELGVAAAQTQGNFLDTYKQLLTGGLQGNSDLSNTNANLANADSGFYRISRAIRGDNFFETNRLSSSNNLNGYSRPRAAVAQVPIYRSDLSYGTANLYPPIDAPHLTEYITVNTHRSDNDDVRHDAHIGEIILPPIGDDFELDLNSASFMDSDAKALLSDGLERCAPGRRRDSYGVCREIEGY